MTPRLVLAEGLPRAICDASQVQQIVTNLVLNAAEAMETGFVTIRTRHDAARGTVVLEVADTGSGIPPDVLPRIFDPFFSTKKEGQERGWAWLWSTASYRRMAGRSTSTRRPAAAPPSWCSCRSGAATVWATARPVARRRHADLPAAGGGRVRR